MKKTFITMLAVTCLGMAYGEDTLFGKNPHTPTPTPYSEQGEQETLTGDALDAYRDLVNTMNISVNDIYGHGPLTNKVTTITDVDATDGKDCIVSMKFWGKEHENWINQMVSGKGDEDSYLGIRREGAAEASDAYSCVGGYYNHGSLTYGYQLLFNRDKPESKLSHIVVPSSEDQYIIQKGDVCPTLQQIHDWTLADNKSVALAILRTPSPYSLDMFCVTFYDETTKEFTDFVMGCEVAHSGDDVGIAELDYHENRFGTGYAFFGENYGVDDIIAANHYTLTGVMPVPEPATATLSLLALAALAARRRR